MIIPIILQTLLELKILLTQEFSLCTDKSYNPAKTESPRKCTIKIHKTQSSSGRVYMNQLIENTHAFHCGHKSKGSKSLPQGAGCFSYL